MKSIKIKHLIRKYIFSLLASCSPLLHIYICLCMYSNTTRKSRTIKSMLLHKLFQRNTHQLMSYIVHTYKYIQYASTQPFHIVGIHKTILTDQTYITFSIYENSPSHQTAYKPPTAPHCIECIQSAAKKPKFVLFCCAMHDMTSLRY